MHKRQEKKLRKKIEIVIIDRDLDFCSRLINEEPDEEAREILREVHKILAKDPDIIGMHYMADKKLAGKKWSTQAERRALMYIRMVTSGVIKEAKEAAKK